MAEKMGILGRKLGMTRIFAGDGASVPVTVVQAGPCPVTQVKTAEKDGYIHVDHLDDNSDFASYQRVINSDPESVPSHAVIKRTIKKFGEDYRYEDAPNPVAALRPRDRDNITLGRVVK